MRLNKTYATFAELKKHLTANKHDCLTFAVDQMLLKASTLDEIKKAIDELKESTYKQSKDFKTLSVIKKHIRYRQSHNHIVFSKSKADKIRIIDIDYENTQSSLF